MSVPEWTDEEIREANDKLLAFINESVEKKREEEGHEAAEGTLRGFRSWKLRRYLFDAINVQIKKKTIKELEEWIAHEIRMRPFNRELLDALGAPMPDHLVDEMVDRFLSSKYGKHLTDRYFFTEVEKQFDRFIEEESDATSAESEGDSKPEG